MLVAVIAVGIFLRGYNFSDWIHFELDQARDVLVISEAVDNGIGNLPLLGPRAAGTFLRLGPAFYYLEYISAKIFGNTPFGVAFIILLFSILTLPLFYLVCRRYFNKWNSLGLLSIFSVSIFLIMYSRFAWNPNLIPFFVLLIFYSLLRVVDKEEKKRDLWMYIFAVSLAIATQLHFLVLLTIPVVSVVFLLVKRPRFSWKVWASSFLIVIFFYSPVIINEIKTGGDNAKEFAEAVSGKSQNEKYSVIEKAIRNYEENAIGSFLILSGVEKAEVVKVKTALKVSNAFEFKCDKDCRKNLPWSITAFIVFSLGIVLLVVRLIKEKDVSRKNFLLFSFLWLIVSFIVFLPVAYDISPRFFLITAPLPFIFLGLIFNFITKLTNKGKWIIIAIITALIVSNSLAIMTRFSQLKKAPLENVKINPDRILKERARVTLEQQQLIVSYISKIVEKNNYPVFLDSESQHDRALKYIIRKEGMAASSVKTSKVYRNGNYFLVFRTSSNLEEEIAKYSIAYKVIEKKEFGTLIVFRLLPEEESITDVDWYFSEDDDNDRSAPGVPERYNWNEIFSKPR